MQKKKDNIIPINWIDDAERYIPVPGYIPKNRPRLKSFIKVKGNCYFAHGVAHKIIDFIYRSVIKLDLKEKKMVFSRGAVKWKNKNIFNSVGIRELDWDVGISIIIPRGLNYNKMVKLSVDNEVKEFRFMELIVLSGLLRLAFPKKASQWYSLMATTIMAKGWDSLQDEPADVTLNSSDQ